MQSQPSYRVLLPVANPEHVEQLASLTAALARANDGQVLALHIQAEPDADGRTPPVLARAEQIVVKADVPVRAIVQVRRDAVTGILEAAREVEAVHPPDGGPGSQDKRQPAAFVSPLARGGVSPTGNLLSSIRSSSTSPASI